MVLSLFQEDSTWTERKLATIPFEFVARPSSTVYSPDGTQVFWAGKSLKTDTARIWTNQEPGEEFDNVQRQVLSENGKTLAYMAFRQRKQFMVVGNRHDPVFDLITQAYLSPDGQVAAYRITKADCEAMVINGKEGPGFDKVHTPIFNPLTMEVAYVTALKGRAPVMVGDREVAVHDQSYFPIWRPDGKELAYGAKDGNEAFVVVGGKRLKSYDSVSGPKYAPDGKTVTYTAHRGDQSWVVVGEKEYGPYENAFAYAVDKDLALSAVAYGKKENRVTSKGRTSAVFEGIKSVTMDVQGRYRFEPATSVDGTRFAFLGVRGGKWRVLHGMEEGPECEEIGTVVLSPSGRHVAYPAKIDGKMVLVVDDRQVDTYDYVNPPQFSRDERKLAFGAQLKTEFWWKVIDLPEKR